MIKNTDRSLNQKLGLPSICNGILCYHLLPLPKVSAIKVINIAQNYIWINLIDHFFFIGENSGTDYKCFATLCDKIFIPIFS